MLPLSIYSLPIQGLAIGMHHFKFDLDETFFKHFESSPIEICAISADVTLDKRFDMLIFDFQISGWVSTACDRCTATIQLGVQDERQLIVKFGVIEGTDDDEVIFIPRDSFEFNLSAYLYEFSVMAIPFIKTYNCEDEVVPPCDFEVLKKIGHSVTEAPPESTNPVWEVLKNIE